MKQKREIITFKADQSLLEALDGVPNRSEFIRTALLNALENTCPVCKGTGILTPNQKRHWQEFSETHSLGKCSQCEEVYLICESGPEAKEVHQENS